ncbi:MAG TPA: Ig-like domain-containing protein [Verrucomicrobiae bacterium]|jgi:plastocyanin
MKLCKCATGYFQVAMVGLAGMVIGSVSSQAATKTVDIIDYAFSPMNVTINVNDTVHWVWVTDLHSSTAGNLSGPPAKDTGLWDSGVSDSGHIFDFTFTASGTYPYYCSYHLFPGTVTVQAASSVGPPTIAITSPTNGADFNAPATFSLAATASETGGSVANVEFFNGATSLGTVLTEPYSVTAQSLGAGDYTFSAIATDSGGLTATNSIVVHVVAATGPPSITITNPANGSIFNAPATFTVGATASETGGSVANVEFFNGATSLGQVSTAPYSVTEANLAAGDYTFSAIATDGVGVTASNSIVVHVVAKTLVNLSSPRFTPPETVQFNYTATSGLIYVVDRAVILGVWTPINTNVASGGSVSFQDSNASGAAQYYRVRQVASP